MKRTPAAVAVLSLVFLSTPPSVLRAGAPPDLTIYVPVKVTKLHKTVDVLWMTCRLFNSVGAEVAATDGGLLPIPPDPQGNFNGVLNNSWIFSNPADFAAAKKYKCTLKVRGGPGTQPMELVDGDGSKYWHLKPGTPRTLTAEGTIP